MRKSKSKAIATKSSLRQKYGPSPVSAKRDSMRSGRRIYGGGKSIDAGAVAYLEAEAAVEYVTGSSYDDSSSSGDSSCGCD